MTAPAIETWTTETEDDDAVHLFCCDENVALCGVDATDFDVVADNDDSPVCIYCDYLDNTCTPCSPECECSCPDCQP